MNAGEILSQGARKSPSEASSVPAAQRWSFGTCALIKLSFKLETSNLQGFLLLSYLLPGNVIIFGVTGLSNKLSVCIGVACIVRHPVIKSLKGNVIGILPATSPLFSHEKKCLIVKCQVDCSEEIFA